MAGQAEDGRQRRQDGCSTHRQTKKPAKPTMPKGAKRGVEVLHSIPGRIHRQLVTHDTPNGLGNTTEPGSERQTPARTHVQATHKNQNNNICTPVATCEAHAAINKSEYRNAVHHFALRKSVLRGNNEGNSEVRAYAAILKSPLHRF
ncbi:hypothetical protein EVAR_57136_1 [Eumeta japonica]|uniref:Uncharacterized protein n=1 Tax=Eumeta variegata TaxID=151549 RepID=A0A4C1YSX3_EUMVA|nr:hypothetical protein EVAR_57136_1 [Eumeta japonica]